MHHYVEDVIDLIDPSLNQIYNMTVDQARARVLDGTPEEVREAAAAGWSPWTIAPVTLRAEHVPLAALAVVRHAWAARRIT